MNDHRSLRRRGFTLVELISVIVIMSTITAVIAPLITAAATTHALATSQRETAESLGAAMEQVVRVLRETPAIESGSPIPDITLATTTKISLANGYVVELIDSTLWLTAPAQAAAPLCVDVTTFELTYLAEDGVTDTKASPDLTQRLQIKMASNEMELRTAVFLRIARAQS